MNINTIDLKKYAPLVARLGIGFVFIWFGWSGITNPQMWMSLVPAWTGTFASAHTLVLLHGWFELIFGILLFAGFWIRITSALLFINLFHTLFLVGYGAILIRDIGLCALTLTVFLWGEDSTT